MLTIKQLNCLPRDLYLFVDHETGAQTKHIDERRKKLNQQKVTIT